ncbi:T9SS type A sorting domain-containing protein [bacterium]|nr:T9SS type A sorting domain-containing protein [bacterium]
MKKITLFVLSLGLGLGAFAQTINGTTASVNFNINDFTAKKGTDVKYSLSATVTEVTNDKATIYIEQEDLYAILYLVSDKATLEQYDAWGEANWQNGFSAAYQLYQQEQKNAFAAQTGNISLDNLNNGVTYGGWFFGLDGQSITSMDQIYPAFVSFTTGAGVGLNDAENTSVSVYPNPASELVKVNTNNNIDNVELINTLGQVVYTSEVNNNATQINVAGMQKGTYFVKINANGKSFTSKVILK